MIIVGALRSVNETHIVFKPDISYDLVAYRLTLGPELDSIRRRVRSFVRRRMKLGFYTNLRLEKVVSA